MAIGFGLALIEAGRDRQAVDYGVDLADQAVEIAERRRQRRREGADRTGGLAQTAVGARPAGRYQHPVLDHQADHRRQDLAEHTRRTAAPRLAPAAPTALPKLEHAFDLPP